MTDEELILAAMEQARLAEQAGDVPIGAVIARGDGIIARAYNRRIIDRDPTAHAEMLAIRQAAAATGDWRLSECTLAVTLEPCIMCAGAIVLARIPRLVYGAADPKAGGVNTLYHICTDPRLNHCVEVRAGIRAELAAELLTQFFRKQRALGKK